MKGFVIIYACLPGLCTTWYSCAKHTRDVFLAVSWVFLSPSGNCPAVLGPADNQLWREPSVPELSAGLQRALQGPGAAAARVAGHAGQTELPHVTRLLRGHLGTPRSGTSDWTRPSGGRRAARLWWVSPLLQATSSPSVIVWHWIAESKKSRVFYTDVSRITRLCGLIEPHPINLLKSSF